MILKDEIEQGKVAFFMIFDGAVNMVKILFNASKICINTLLKREPLVESDLLEINLFKRFIKDYEEDEEVESVEYEDIESVGNSDLDGEGEVSDSESEIYKMEEELSSEIIVVGMEELNVSKPQSLVLDRIRKRKGMPVDDSNS